MKLPMYIVLFLLGLAIAHGIYFYPLLPDIVGSHYGVTGKVNHSLPKLAYFMLYFVSLVITSSFAVVLPLALKYLPLSLINLPHREYWLSDEHKEETLSFFNVHMSWFSVATTLFTIAIFHLTFQASLSKIGELNMFMFWGLFGAFFLFMIWWTVVLLRRFSAPS